MARVPRCTRDPKPPKIDSTACRVRARTGRIQAGGKAARHQRRAQPPCRRGIPPRGTVITPPQGQQVLQATLLEIFAHPTTEHPWNPTGRTLTHLFDCYGSWICPQPDRFIMGSTLAMRMVGYLLPYIRDADTGTRHRR
jgi:hypothetical protein